MITLYIESFHHSYAVCVAVSDDVIVDSYYSFNADNDQIDNIYSGIVTNKTEAIGAYFVNYGERKNGFLPYSLTKTSLAVGDQVFVQVLRPSKGNKGAKLSQFIKIFDYNTGEILTPYGNPGSKNIPDTDNAQNRKWQLLIAGKSNNIELVYPSKTALEKFLYKYRDLANEVFIDSSNMNHFTRLCQSIGIKNSILHQCTDTMPILCKHNLSEAFDSITSDTIRLSSGGVIVISHTEAMITIDVNSASCREQDPESTALLVNLEAAGELPRQIKLRNLSGIIAIDFIDMNLANNRSIIEEVFRKNMSDDYALHNISSINNFGVLMLSRQASNLSLAHSIKDDTCQFCGSVKHNMHHVVRKAIIDVRLSIVSNCENKVFTIKCSSDILVVLYNEYKDYLSQLERRHNIVIRTEVHNVSEVIVYPKVQLDFKKKNFLNQNVNTAKKYVEGHNICYIESNISDKIHDMLLMDYGLYVSRQ